MFLHLMYGLQLLGLLYLLSCLLLIRTVLFLLQLVNAHAKCAPFMSFAVCSCLSLVHLLLLFMVILVISFLQFQSFCFVHFQIFIFFLFLRQLEIMNLNSWLWMLRCFYLIRKSLKVNTLRFLNYFFFIGFLDFEFIELYSKSFVIDVLLKSKWRFYLLVVNIIKTYWLEKFVLFYLLSILLESQPILFLFLKQRL